MDHDRRDDGPPTTALTTSSFNKTYDENSAVWNDRSGTHYMICKPTKEACDMRSRLEKTQFHCLLAVYWPKDTLPLAKDCNDVTILTKHNEEEEESTNTRNCIHMKQK